MNTTELLNQCSTKIRKLYDQTIEDWIGNLRAEVKFYRSALEDFAESLRRLSKTENISSEHWNQVIKYYETLIERVQDTEIASDNLDIQSYWDQLSPIIAEVLAE